MMGRLLGIDYGGRRVGLALTDALRMIASPFDVYLNNSEFFIKLKKLCNDYQFDKIILGYPHSDTYTEASNAVLAFAENLKKETGLNVEFQNEEFSTVFAASYLKAGGKTEKQIKNTIDKYAAQKILQDYLRDHPEKLV